MPPLQWSICKQFTVTTCTFGRSDIFGLLYGEVYTDDTECTYKRGTIPNHAKSKEAFWNSLPGRGETFTATEFVRYIDIWNRTSKEWRRIFGDSRDMKEEHIMFRYSFTYIIKNL